MVVNISQMLSLCYPDSPKVVSLEKKPDIFAKKWDQSTMVGRLKHFAMVVNPLNLLVSEKKLIECKSIVLDYKVGKVDKNLTVDELWRAKHFFDSAFHPQSYRISSELGRFSCQVPSNTFIHAGMMTFYKHPLSVMFWQWLNQTSNAVVNYSNRASIDESSNQRLFNSYCMATGGALVTSLGLNYWLKQKNLPPVVGRLVPFASIAIANAINIPTMRYNEFETGITVTDEEGNKIGSSTEVAKTAILTVLVSRVIISIPDMCLTPFAMDYVAKQPWCKGNRWIAGPIQTTLTCIALMIATPVGCALFPQDMSTTVDKLEPHLQDNIRSNFPLAEKVYFNKGL